MRDWLTWFLTNWHWFAGVLALAVILVIVGAMLALRAGEGDPSEVARFDAYLDDVEDGYIDLPGPDHVHRPDLYPPYNHWGREIDMCPTLDTESFPGPVAPAPWVGELHPYEPAFPAILQLGQPGDGTENTFTRMDMYRMTVRNAVEAARRELAAECGIRYVPMELVAA